MDKATLKAAGRNLRKELRNRRGAFPEIEKPTEKPSPAAMFDGDKDDDPLKKAKK